MPKKIKVLGYALLIITTLVLVCFQFPFAKRLVSKNKKYSTNQTEQQQGFLGKFEFLQDFEDCLEIIKENYEVGALRFVDKRYHNSQTGIDAPRIIFLEFYKGFLATTELEFTPLSKKLKSIKHSIPLRSFDDYYNTIQILYYSIEEYYGDPFIEQEKVFGSPCRGLFTSFSWKKDEIFIFLDGSYNAECPMKIGYEIDKIIKKPIKGGFLIPLKDNEVKISLNSQQAGELVNIETEKIEAEVAH